jgi:hypothetical protein
MIVIADFEDANHEMAIKITMKIMTMKHLPLSVLRSKIVSIKSFSNISSIKISCDLFRGTRLYRTSRWRPILNSAGLPEDITLKIPWREAAYGKTECVTSLQAA